MGVLGDLYAGRANFDFRRLWRIGAIASAVLVIIAGGALIIRSLNLGIDFDGGTSWEVPVSDVGVGEARDALRPVGQDQAAITILGGDVLRVRAAATDEATIDAVSEALGELASIAPSEVGVTTVGPTWGDEITSKAQRALLVFFVLIAAYITIRFDWRMATAALVAVVHDLVLTVGFYALLQFEVTPATVIAFLTILGYSLYDTIVVFDKVRDNLGRPALVGSMSFPELVSLSSNQVLMRSVNTTLTSILPILSMLVVGSFILGATTLQEFAIALAIGLLTGAYSSIFVASPLLVWLHRFGSDRVDGHSGGDGESKLATRARSSPRVAAAVAASGGAAPRPRKRKRRS